MHIALIGMSGIGKSAWAARLAAHGYALLDVDAAIARRVGDRVGRQLDDVYGLGAWMGLPYQRGYAAREALFLAEELLLLEAALPQLEMPAPPMLLDLGGSAIYAGGSYFDRLRRSARIVYLAADHALLPALITTYLAQPKPVVWDGAYRRWRGEPPQAAIERCYPLLLAERAARYAAIADITLPAALHRDPATTVPALLSAIGP